MNPEAWTAKEWLALLSFITGVVIGLFKLIVFLTERVKNRTRFEDGLLKAISNQSHSLSELTKRVGSIEHELSNVERRQGNVAMLQLGRAILAIPTDKKREYRDADQLAQAIVDRYQVISPRITALGDKI